VQIAEAIVVVWGEIDNVLAPIIGHRSVVALCKRSLYLTAMRHECLRGIYKSVQPGAELSGTEFIDLQPIIAQQCDLTIDIGNDLLQQFHELLASLIGGSLSKRLLRSVWDNSTEGPPTQEAPS